MAKMKDGKEIFEKGPMEIPSGLKRPPTLQERIAQMVRVEFIKQKVEKQGMETPAEADDFDTGEGDEFRSPWELTPDQEAEALQNLALEAKPAAAPAAGGVEAAKPPTETPKGSERPLDKP